MRFTRHLIRQWLNSGLSDRQHLLFSVSLAIATLTLSYLHWSHHKTLRTIFFYGVLPILVYVLGFLLVLLEPTNRLGWYFD
jgi:hypothetical protein